MRAIVTGMIASYPVGGVLWDYGQYALGLERLGFEVYYLEDTGWQTYDPVQGAYSEDCSYGVRFLERSLAALSPALGARWHFRAMDGRTFGMSAAALAEVISTADIFLNVSGGTLLRDEYMACRRKVLIDSDPGWNHFRNYPKWDASPRWQGTHGYRAHDYFFTYAEQLGRADCVLPSLGLPWQPTRPVVVLDQWREEPPGDTWTTVMTWKNFQEPIVYDGVAYGTKEMEFERIQEAARHVGRQVGLLRILVQQPEFVGLQLREHERIRRCRPASREQAQHKKNPARAPRLHCPSPVSACAAAPSPARPYNKKPPAVCRRLV